jgi:hypothetical protein
MSHLRLALACLLAALLLCAGCLLPAQQPEPLDDDTADDDDMSDDDVTDDDDDTTPTDDDDDDTTPPDDDDDTTPTDDDDDSMPPHPIGDYAVGWAWVFAYEDVEIGAEFASYSAVWNIAGNGINGSLRMGLLDGDINEICAMEMSLAGAEVTPSFSVATAAWAVDGQFTIDDCYETFVGQTYEAYLGVAPKNAAYADIQARYGISVAEQEQAEVDVAHASGLDPSDYFMYIGDVANDMGPLGFMFEM